MWPLQVQSDALEASLVNMNGENMLKLIEYYSQRAKKHWDTKGTKILATFNMSCLSVEERIK